MDDVKFLFTPELLMLQVDEREYLATVTLSPHILLKFAADIGYIELPEKGVFYRQGNSGGLVESSSFYYEYKIPLTGVIVDVNQQLELFPERFYEEEKNWLFKMDFHKRIELDDLLTIEKYNYCVDYIL